MTLPKKASSLWASIKMGAKINWMALVQHDEASPALFPVLFALDILPVDPPTLEFSSSYEVTALAEQLLRLMPMCELFSPEGPWSDVSVAAREHELIGTEEVTLRGEFNRLKIWRQNGAESGKIVAR